MKAIAWGIVLGIAAPAAWAQQASDGIVTVRKKGSIWSFKVTPERRGKLVVEEKEVETDIPQRLHVAWALEEPYAQPRNNNIFVISGTCDSKSVHFFREGKEYAEDRSDWPRLQSRTRDELSGLQKSLVEEFYQFDLDFPGGGWDELAKLIRERLTSACEQQFPDLLKPFLPGKVEIEISSKPKSHARYPAIQAKGVTLAMLRSFGPGPLVEGKTESIPRLAEQADKSVELTLDVNRSLAKLVLFDGNALDPDSLEVAFFHLGSKSTLPGADHVVALFEMAWKAKGAPLYAKVKYHPETKTLMVQGTSEEIQAADKVFATLTGRPSPVEPNANPFDTIHQTLERIAELLKKQSEEKDK